MSLDGYSDTNWNTVLQGCIPKGYGSITPMNGQDSTDTTPLFNTEGYGALTGLQNQNGLFPTSPLTCGMDIGEFSTFSSPQIMPFGMNFMPQMNIFSLMLQSLTLQINNIFAQYSDTMSNLSLTPPLDSTPSLTTDVTTPPSRRTSSGTLASNMPAGYGNYNFDVTKKYTGSAEDLNKQLKGVLKGKGDVFIRLQEKYGVNAAFLVALVNAESGYGSSNGAKTKNNVAGIMSAESGYRSLKHFNNVDECLEALAKNLKNNYINKGRTTISQIHEKYCPIGASNDPTGMNKNWGSTISQLTNKYENAVA